MMGNYLLRVVAFSWRLLQRCNLYTVFARPLRAVDFGPGRIPLWRSTTPRCLATSPSHRRARTTAFARASESRHGIVVPTPLPGGRVCLLRASRTAAPGHGSFSLS